MTRLFQLTSLILTAFLLQGCALYGGATDERLSGTMTDDKTLTTSIKTKLMSDDVASGWNISVYSFYGHVFLVGTCPKDLRAKAVKIAQKDKRVLSLTTHWFEPVAGGENNFILSTSIRSALIGADGVNNTHFETEVNSGRVVLLGVARDAKERKAAVQTVRNVKGVSTVTSYIMLPKKQGINYMPTGTTYQGLKPAGKAPADKDKAKAKSGSTAPEKAHDVEYDDPDRPDLSPEK